MQTCDETRSVQPGDVVQLRADTAYPYCFMVILEVKATSVVGYVFVPQSQGKLPGRVYLRAKHDEMATIGKQVWAPPFF